MYVIELDEFQGCTPQMAKKWLLNTGWKHPGGYYIHQSHGYSVPDEWLSAEKLHIAISHIAECHSKTPQFVLREMNSRLTTWPSAAAIAAHSSKWLAQRQDDGVVIAGYMVLDDGEWRLASEIGEMYIDKLNCVEDGHWRVWPCDRAGNRVRYPTDSEGKML